MNFDPDLVVIAMTVVVTAIGVPLARALARHLETRTTAAATRTPEMLARLEAIEHAVEVIAVEVERIAEGQRFTTKLLTTKLLAGRGGAMAPPPSSAEDDPSATPQHPVRT
jgi:hypothetical protein